MISILKLLRLWIPFGDSGAGPTPTEGDPVRLVYAVPGPVALTYKVAAPVPLVYDPNGAS